MDDLISRQAAIDILDDFADNTLEVVGGSYETARKKMCGLPSAQPERKNRHWEMVPDPYGFFDEIPVCSECGCTTEMRKTYKFCPNCGADMRSEQDESV